MIKKIKYIKKLRTISFLIIGLGIILSTMPFVGILDSDSKWTDDNIIDPESSDLLFIEDFEIYNTTYDSQFNNTWSEHTPDVGAIGNVYENISTAISTKTLYLKAEATGPGFRSHIYDRLPLLDNATDFDLSIDLKAMNTYNYSGISEWGIDFRVDDFTRESCYRVGFSINQTQTINIWKVLGQRQFPSTKITLNSTPFALSLPNNYLINISCVGSEIKVFVDGTPVLTAYDSELNGSYFGLYVGSGHNDPMFNWAEVHFDNLIVNILSGEDTTGPEISNIIVTPTIADNQTGTIVTISATITDPSGVLNPTVILELIDGVPDQYLPLFDDGTNGDLIPGDNNYSAQWDTINQQGGIWLVDINCTDNSPNYNPSYFDNISTINVSDMTPPELSWTNLDKYSGPAGTIVEINCSIYDPQEIISHYVYISLAGSTLESIQLYDDGLHNDQAPYDDIYATVWNTTGYAPGTYEINIYCEDALFNGMNYTGEASFQITDNSTVSSPPGTPYLYPITPNPNTDGNVSIYWDSVPYADGYYIYRENVPIDDLNVSSFIPHYTTNNNIFNDTITKSDLYYYAIVAYNASGNSSVSNCENVTVNLPGVSPPSPTLATISPNPDDDGDIYLSWNSVSLCTYNIYRNSTFIINTANTYFYDWNLLEGEYNYQITAINGSGESPLSNLEWVVVDYPDPPAPILYAITPNPDYDGDVQLSWSYISSASSYRIYRDLAPIVSLSGLTAIASTIGTEYLDAGLESGTYYYAIVTVNENGTSPISNSESVEVIRDNSEPSSIPAAPILYPLIYHNDSNTIEISWSIVEGASYYRLYRATEQEIIDEIIAYFSGENVTFNIADYAISYTSSTSYNDQNIVMGERYFYVVTAINSYGESEASNMEYILISDGTDNNSSSNGSDDGLGPMTIDSYNSVIIAPLMITILVVVMKSKKLALK